MQNMEKIEARYREKKGVENKGTAESNQLFHTLIEFHLYSADVP